MLIIQANNTNIRTTKLNSYTYCLKDIEHTLTLLWNDFKYNLLQEKFIREVFKNYNHLGMNETELNWT